MHFPQILIKISSAGSPPLFLFLHDTPSTVILSLLLELLIDCNLEVSMENRSMSSWRQCIFSRWYEHHESAFVSDRYVQWRDLRTCTKYHATNSAISSPYLLRIFPLCWFLHPKLSVFDCWNFNAKFDYNFLLLFLKWIMDGHYAEVSYEFLGQWWLKFRWLPQFRFNFECLSV